MAETQYSDTEGSFEAVQFGTEKRQNFLFGRLHLHHFLNALKPSLSEMHGIEIF